MLLYIFLIEIICNNTHTFYTFLFFSPYTDLFGTVYLLDYLSILCAVCNNSNVGMRNNSQCVDFTISIRVYHLIIHSITVDLERQQNKIKKSRSHICLTAVMIQSYVSQIFLHELYKFSLVVKKEPSFYPSNYPSINQIFDLPLW